jgi:RNA polymerase sigma factor (sigma-70 family)
MSESQELILIKAFLTERGGRPSSDQATAWEDFLLTHEPTVRAVVRDRPDCRHDVEDVVQEIWKVLIQQLPKLQYDPGRGTLRGWVIAVARREAARQARRLSRSRIEALTPELAAVLPDRDADPVTLSERKRVQEEVRAILAELNARLPELTNRIIVLHWFEERTVPDIAAELGLSVYRVSRRLREARQAIRVLLRGGGRELP